MKKKIKISIIMAVFNRANVVEQAISSVVNQTYEDIEFIVIDGGSTDSTVDIIKKYSDKIAHWVSEPDRGIYDAFNKGVKAATGDYVEFIGSDDCLVSDDIICKVVDAIEENTDILSACVYIVNTDGYQWIFDNKNAIDKKNYIGGMIPHPGMFSKRELLLMYPFDTSYRVAGDFKFFLQCYVNPKVTFKYIDLPVVFFSLTGISSAFSDMATQECDRLYEELSWPYRVKDIQNANNSGVKKMIKGVLKSMGLFDAVNAFKYRYFVGEKHHCNNKICRWCGRK